MVDGAGMPKILLVDDEPVNIELLEAVLQEDGELLFATSGAVALAVADKGKDFSRAFPKIVVE